MSAQGVLFSSSLPTNIYPDILLTLRGEVVRRSLVLALIGAILLAACGGDSDRDKSGPISSSSGTSSSASSSFSSGANSSVGQQGNSGAGKQLYEQGCQICHGANGGGNTQLASPGLVNCTICNNRAALANYIETSMPPGGMQAAQACVGECAEDVAAYIIEAFNPEPDFAACDSGAASPSPSDLKRLSRQEYRNTLIDLLQLSNAPNLDVIPDDPSVHNFKTVASVQNVQASHLNGYITVATEQAELLMRSANRRDGVLGCNYTNPNCLNEFVSRFGRLAYRRPLNTEESQRIISHIRAVSTSAEDDFILAIQLLLSSPNFIYRLETGDSLEGLAQLNSYELASRLAFSLWGRGPNSDLLDKAARGELDTPEGLSRVAREMVQDDRAQENMSLFFEQWLATNQVVAPVNTPSNWYSGILEDIKQETDALLQEYAWQDKNFMEVLTASHTYVSPNLASYYGLARPKSSAAVDLPAGSPRHGTGILTHLASMLPKTDGDLVSIRGDWLRATFLCKKLEFPEGISEILNGELAGLTSLEIMVERNINASCNRCHAQIDPIGVAFAAFNRDGLFDSSINVADLPLAPGFPDAGNVSIESVQDIARALSRMPEVGQCLAERLFLYTRNHEPVQDDHCAVRSANQNFHDSGYSFVSLLLSLVEDPSFRMRYVPELIDSGFEGEAELQNVALFKPVTASSAQAGNPPSRLTDDNILGDSRWAAQVFPQHAVIDLGDVYTIVQSEVYPYMDRAYRYRLEVSTNGTNYTQVVDRSQNTQGGNVIRDVFAPVDARYVRLVVTGAHNYSDNWVAFRQVRIFGTK